MDATTHTDDALAWDELPGQRSFCDESEEPSWFVAMMASTYRDGGRVEWHGTDVIFHPPLDRVRRLDT